MATTEIDNLFGFTRPGGWAVRGVAFDVGPVNFACAFGELTAGRLPPAFDVAWKDSNQVDSWCHVLAAFHIDLKNGKDNILCEKFTSPRLVEEYPSYRPLPKNTFKDIESEKGGGGGDPKTTALDEPNRVYPRMVLEQAIRGYNLSEYQTLMKRFAKLFTDDSFLWLFQKQWPVFIENQVDELKEERIPINWAISLAIHGIIHAIDRACGYRFPRIISFTASKYGLNVAIPYLYPDYDQKHDNETASQYESRRYRARKAASEFVAHSVAIKTGQLEYNNFLNSKDKKNDDDADAFNMLLEAWATCYRSSPLNKNEKQQVADTIKREYDQVKLTYDAPIGKIPAITNKEERTIALAINKKNHKKKKASAKRTAAVVVDSEEGSDSDPDYVEPASKVTTTTTTTNNGRQKRKSVVITPKPSAAKRPSIIKTPKTKRERDESIKRRRIDEDDDENPRVSRKKDDDNLNEKQMDDEPYTKTHGSRVARFVASMDIGF